MKYLGLIMLGILVFGVFATSLAIAENEEVTNVSEITSDSVTAADTETILAEVEQGNAGNQMRAVTLAEGWVVYLDSSKAEVARVLWASKGDSKALGRLYVGSGKDMEKYKLAKKEVLGDSTTFYVLPINEKYNSTHLAVGTLTLNKKQYTNLALWTGSLTFGSGKYSGTWNMELASKTKVFRNAEQQQAKPEKVSWWKRLLRMK